MITLSPYWMLQALIWESVSGEFDPDETAIIHKRFWMLKTVPLETLRNALCDILLGENATQVMLEYRDVIRMIIPELPFLFYESAACAATNPKYDKLNDKLARLLLYVDPSSRGKVLDRLCFDEQTKLTILSKVGDVVVK